jgi:ribosomal protein L37AE/L43A
MTDEKAIEKMVYDQQQGWPLCPRCGERMPDKLTHRALSRHAKGVYICEACGTDEALRDWTGNVKPLSNWVLVRVYNGDLRR